MRLPDGIEKYDENNPAHRALRRRFEVTERVRRLVGRVASATQVKPGGPTYDVNGRADVEAVWSTIDKDSGQPLESFATEPPLDATTGDIDG